MPQNVAPYQERFDRRVNPRGRTYFWTGLDYGCPEPHPETDEHFLRDGYVTVTPLQFDLTDHRALPALEKREWSL